jgi:anthranilate synthase component 1
MEIIDELEPNPRGPYGGALGYFSANGSADFAITIRSLFILKNSAYIQAGAGIVIDSVPQKEWLETEQKANALLSAVKYSKPTNN